MNLEDSVKAIGKEIYNKVLTFVQENKGDDDKFYEDAIIRLNDGRKIIIALDTYNNSLSIWNYQWNDEFQGGPGDSFRILPKSSFGFFVGITLYYLDKEDIDLIVSDKCYIHKNVLNNEQEKYKIIYNSII